MSTKFHPSEREKIAYLLHKVTGKPLHLLCNRFFVVGMVIDHYNEPWKIYENHSKSEDHFFVRPENIRQTENDGGTWQSVGLKIGIFDSKNQVIGYVQDYIFRSKKNDDQDLKWHLREYTIADKFMRFVKDEDVGHTFCSLKKGTTLTTHQEDKYVNTQDFFDQFLIENEGSSYINSSTGFPNNLSI